MAGTGQSSDSFTIDDSGGGDDSVSVVDPVTLAGGTNAGGDSGDGEFDPAVHIGRDRRNADGSYRRKRARRGTAAASTKVPKNIDPKGIEALLLSIHLGLSMRIPEMALDATESAKLAQAIADVQSHYPIAVIDPKIVAWCNLGIATVMIYGPRAYNIRERIIREGRKPAKGANGVEIIGTGVDLNDPFGMHAH